MNSKIVLECMKILREIGNMNEVHISWDPLLSPTKISYTTALSAINKSFAVYKGSSYIRDTYNGISDQKYACIY